MSYRTETEVKYRGNSDFLGKISRNKKKSLGVQSENSSNEINNKNTLSQFAKIKIKTIKLPQILTHSTNINHNKRIIKLKKKLLNNNQNDFLLTGIDTKKYEKDDIKNNEFLSNQNIDNNKLYEVSELLIADNENNNEYINLKQKLILNNTPNVNNSILKKMIIRKKPKNIEKIKSHNYIHSSKYLDKMLHCYIDYQRKNLFEDFKKSEKKLEQIDNKIHNMFNVMREESEIKFQELLNKDEIDLQ